MIHCDTLIRHATIFDGTGADSQVADVVLCDGTILAIGDDLKLRAKNEIDALGLALAPGFIDVHTHDDLFVIRDPDMKAKISQGVTTVIVGNCGISASPVRLRNDLPDPMNLLGTEKEFRFPTFSAYTAAIDTVSPAVNVAALIGHTALRNNHMNRLDRTATSGEIAGMREQLKEALDGGALGLSSGLAYLSAYSATAEEVIELARPLGTAGAVYATHMRTEADAILDAMQEAFETAHHSHVPLVISHLKCAGVDNWGRSDEVLSELEKARSGQSIGCDCYPYSASSSTLDIRQVDERLKIVITWSTPHPEVAGQTLAQVAALWSISQQEAARRVQPAGAIYHGMSEEDVRRILRHPATMIGSDGLPSDPRPHPRLWGTFPRVLGHYSREENLFSLSEAVRKMTGLAAQRFGLEKRGFVREGYFADLVLFNPETVRDRASFEDPIQPATGIECVWVNGVLSYRPTGIKLARAGRFVRRGKTSWVQ